MIPGTWDDRARPRAGLTRSRAPAPPWKERMLVARRLPSLMTPTDARIAAAVAGDRQALEALVLDLLPRVRNLVRYLVRGDQDVEDLAQEALIAIVRGLPGHRVDDGRFLAWADRVAVRATFHGLRRSRRVQAGIDHAADLAAVPHPGERPDEYSRRRAAARLLDALPEEQRQVVVLHHVVDLSVPEIADELGVPFETVRSRIRLGMARLRAVHGRTGDAP